MLSNSSLMLENSQVWRKTSQQIQNILKEWEDLPKVTEKMSADNSEEPTLKDEPKL